MHEGSLVGLWASHGSGKVTETGKRRVIDYLLSPVERAVSESIRER
jgi:hypothetical protein